MRIVTALLAAALASSSLALAADRFADARGDAGDGPDIIAVALSHTDATVTVSVTFASAPPLRFDEDEGFTDVLLVAVHTDDDLRQRDVEFWTGAHGVNLESAAPVVAAAGAASRRVGTADVVATGQTVALGVSRELLGGPDAVAVQVAAGREHVDEGAAGGEGDVAPSSGAHRYVLEDGGAPPWLWPVVAAGLGLGVAALFAWRRLGRRGKLRVAA